MWTYQTVTNNPYLHINVELLLMSRTDYTMQIFLCLLVIVVHIDDVISAKTCIICKGH
jgi:hypothetical protein